MAKNALVVKTYCELTKAQRKDVHSRMKPPYIGYLYKIASNGRVHYRQRRMAGRQGV